MGQVCRKHEEFYEEACRWCELPPFIVPAAAPPASVSLGGGNPNAQANAQQNQAMGLGATGAIGMCACGRFMVAGPYYRYFDGKGYLHTGPACQVTAP